jgi:hypothetical protein
LPVLASAQPAITDVSPNSAARGATVGVQITGSETIFLQDSDVTSVVWLQQNGSRIDATTVDVTSATLLDATFEIPGNAPLGLWDVNVEQVGGAVVTLLDGFTILSGCGISDLAAGTQTGCVPATNTYTQQVIVTFANPPSTGNLVVNGQNFTIGTSPQTVTLTGLTANGNAVNVTANFSAEVGCSRTENSLFTAPPSCAVQPCSITDLAAGTQTGCVPATNTYTQQVVVTFAAAPSTGNLVVNGQTFAIGTSPQTVTLTGLVANGAAVNVTANFSANTTCSRTENALFTAPASCAPVCGISDLAAGTQTACVPATNTYTQQVIVTFANAPATGNLVVNGQNFTIGTSPQTVTLTGLVANGAAVNVTASFSANTTCSRTENALFTAPANCEVQPCSISDLAAGTQTGCVPATNTYTQQVIVTFANAPATGNLVVNGQTFTIGTSPQTVTLTGLNANGGAVNVTAAFSANTSCSRTENALFTAPASCAPVCGISDLAAGTQTGCVPATNTYTQEVIVTFANPPATGNLVVNGQSFTIGTSPQTVTLTGLVANGAAVNVTASFSANASCSRTETALFTAPARCRQGDAPDCSEAEPSIAKLWPPNHKFQKVSIRGVTDPDGGDVHSTITGVTSDEPVNGNGDGNTCPDAKIKSNGRVELRAERSGDGNGRVYAIHFTATDETDDSCDGVVFVCVPPNKSSESCVRDETQYDVTRCTAAKAGEESPGLPLVARAEGDQIAILITTEESGPVDLAIFDLRGRLVRRLAARDFPAGEHTLHWDGRDTNGREVANGLYFVRVVMSGEAHTSKTVWMR